MRFSERIEYKADHLDTYLVLLSAPLLLSIYRAWGASGDFSALFPGLAGNPLSGFFAVLYQWSVFFLLLGALPVLFARFKMGTSFKEQGGGAGDLGFGALAVTAALPLLLVIAYFSARFPDIAAEYPLARVLFVRTDLVIWNEIAYVLLYYTAWEYYFRGFLLFSLAIRFGGVNAILIQTIPSALVHIGKPDGELLGSILAGIALGALALRTRSFWYGFVIHATLGVAVDLFVLAG